MGKNVKRKMRKFYFQVVESKELMESKLECLELSTRAYRALQRKNISTVGDLVKELEFAQREDNLKFIARNLGSGAAHEIMIKLWEYNLKCMKPDKMIEYLMETFEKQDDQEFRPDGDDDAIRRKYEEDRKKLEAEKAVNK